MSYGLNSSKGFIKGDYMGFRASGQAFEVQASGFRL